MFQTVPYVVQPGNTLSQIAAEHGTTWQQLWRENDPPITNPNVIYAGQVIQLSGGSQQYSEPTYSQPYSQPAQSSPSPSQVPYSPPQGQSSGNLADIPGVPVSFACIAYRESTDDENPAADGDVYGIIPASGYNVSGDSIAQQKQVVRELYDADGLRPWAADGCPGT